MKIKILTLRPRQKSLDPRAQGKKGTNSFCSVFCSILKKDKKSLDPEGAKGKKKGADPKKKNKNRFFY